MTKAEQKLLRQQHEHDWRWMIASVQGRRILGELIEMSGLMGPTVSESPMRMAHAEGRRSLGGEIYARLTHVAESAEVPALLAEVLIRGVRNSRRPEPDPDSEPDAG